MDSNNIKVVSFQLIPTHEFQPHDKAFLDSLGKKGVIDTEIISNNEKVSVNIFVASNLHRRSQENKREKEYKINDEVTLRLEKYCRY